MKAKYSLEQEQEENSNHSDGFGMYWSGFFTCLKEISFFLDSLQQEQQEVDLEKELDAWRHNHFKGKRDGHYSGEYLERISQLDLARYFFELRKNAK